MHLSSGRIDHPRRASDSLLFMYQQPDSSLRLRVFRGRCAADAFLCGSRACEWGMCPRGLSHWYSSFRIYIFREHQRAVLPFLIISVHTVYIFVKSLDEPVEKLFSSCHCEYSKQSILWLTQLPRFALYHTVRGFARNDKRKKRFLSRQTCLR